MSGCARRPRCSARAWLAAYPVERRVAERRLELVHLALLVLDLHARRHRRARSPRGSPNDAARVGREPRRATHGEPGVARSAARKALVALRFPSRRARTKFVHSSPDFLDSKIMVLPNRPPRPPRRRCLTPQPALSRRQIAALSFVSAYQAPALAPRTAASRLLLLYKFSTKTAPFRRGRAAGTTASRRRRRGRAGGTGSSRPTGTRRRAAARARRRWRRRRR